eukprot:scaffold14638_cov87-Cyclotella_meneghiniana.AAC.10
MARSIEVRRIKCLEWYVKIDFKHGAIVSGLSGYNSTHNEYFLHFPTALQIKNKKGNAKATKTLPPYAAILALPAALSLPLASGSTLTFKDSAVVDVPIMESVENVAVRGAWISALFVGVVKACTLATRRMIAMSLYILKIGRGGKTELGRLRLTALYYGGVKGESMAGERNEKRRKTRGGERRGGS